MYILYISRSVEQWEVSEETYTRWKGCASQEESTASGMKNLVSWLKLGPEMVLPLRGPEFYSFFNT